MSRQPQNFILTEKRSKEVVNKLKASSLSEAIKMFAIVKQLRPDQLLELYSVYEEHNGKRPVKKRS